MLDEQLAEHPARGRTESAPDGDLPRYFGKMKRGCLIGRYHPSSGVEPCRATGATKEQGGPKAAPLSPALTAVT